MSDCTSRVCTLQSLLTQYNKTYLQMFLLMIHNLRTVFLASPQASAVFKKDAVGTLKLMTLMSQNP
jgi:hypothetical protein